MTPAAVEMIGLDARRVLSPGRGEIAAVFRRSFYVRIGGRFVCGGAAEIGRGPLNLLLRAEDDLDWRCLLTPGRVADVQRDLLRIEGHPPIDLAGAAIWQPPPVPDWSAASIKAGLAELDHLLELFPPPMEGLGQLARVGVPGDTAVTRAAEAPVRSLSAWLSAGCPACGEPAVEDLIGLGPGLTPSGDDFLAGVLAILHAINRIYCRYELWRRIEPFLVGGTGAISAAHLQCASEGRLAAAQHDLLGALIAGKTADLRDAILDLSENAHTSSWDGLAGMTTALRAIFRSGQ